MIPVRDIRNNAMALLAADTASLSPVTPNKIRLAMNNFNAAESTVIGDLDEATFDGYGAIACGASPMLEGYDPTTDASVISIKVPVGGFRFVTSGITDLPQTIYGYYLTSSDGSDLIATQKFATPIVLTGSSQVIDVGDPMLALQPNSIS